MTIDEYIFDVEGEGVADDLASSAPVSRRCFRLFTTPFDAYSQVILGRYRLIRDGIVGGRVVSDRYVWDRTFRRESIGKAAGGCAGGGMQFKFILLRHRV